MAQIQWTDTIGAATLTNSKPSPGNRFRGWTPFGGIKGAEEEALGTGQLFTFSFRDEYLVAFAIEAIPRSAMALMLRLQRHLAKGGTVSVQTEDSSSRTYATCCSVKGQPAQIQLSDQQSLEYTMTFTLRNVAESPTDFICTY